MRRSKEIEIGNLINKRITEFRGEVCSIIAERIGRAERLTLHNANSNCFYAVSIPELLRALIDQLGYDVRSTVECHRVVLEKRKKGQKK